MDCYEWCQKKNNSLNAKDPKSKSPKCKSPKGRKNSKETTGYSPLVNCENDLKNDGYCDDGNNYEECDWDGGDCCGSDVNTFYCVNCECLDPNAEVSKITNRNGLWIFSEKTDNRRLDAGTIKMIVDSLDKS